MLNCSLLHNQSVPTGALQKYINIVKDQFLSPDLSVDKAYEIIIGQLRCMATTHQLWHLLTIRKSNMTQQRHSSSPLAENYTTHLKGLLFS